MLDHTTISTRIEVKFKNILLKKCNLYFEEYISSVTGSTMEFHTHDYVDGRESQKKKKKMGVVP